MRLYWKQSPDGTASANLGYWNDLKVEPGSSGWNVLHVHLVDMGPPFGRSGLRPKTPHAVPVPNDVLDAAEGWAQEVGLLCPMCGEEPATCDGLCRECDIADTFRRGSCRECGTFLIRPEYGKPVRDQHEAGCSLKDDPDPYPSKEGRERRSVHLGVARGRFDVPASIDQSNEELAEEFLGKSE